MSQQHITACAPCANEWARLSNIVAFMREDRSEDAPRDVVFSVVNMFRAARPAQPSLVRRVLAALSFDSATLTPAYGLRSGAPAATRQILYSAEGYDLDLRVTVNGAQATLAGQVLGADCANAKVVLQNAATQTQTTLNDLSEFTLSAVPCGVYTLHLHIAGLELEIPDLTL